MKASIRVAWALAAWAALVGVPRAGETERARHLDEIRERLRSEAGITESAPLGDDLPLIAVTVLAGDTHGRLALDLTGSLESESILKKIEPVLEPGSQIFVPRALLAPRLTDPHLESIPLGGSYPTLWSLATQAAEASVFGAPATVRNLQRLNAIVDPTRLHRGARIRVPRSLASNPSALPHPKVRFRQDYRVSDLEGLGRQPRATDFPRALRSTLEKRGQWQRQLEHRDVDLVVIHTTEHQGAPFANVARYMQRKRLTNYVVGPAGEIFQIVPESYRAHGCGQSLWEGLYGVDYGAINVEIFADTAPGRHHGEITAAQYQGLARLLADLRARYPAIHQGRIVTHKMVAVSYAFGTRSRKGDPYAFEWARAGLSDNSRMIDQDVLLGRVKMCTDERYSDRVTSGQTAAKQFLHTL